MALIKKITCMEVTKGQIIEIKKWEDENWFLAAKLQEECLSYEHYLSEVLLCLEKDMNYEK